MLIDIFYFFFCTIRKLYVSLTTQGGLQAPIEKLPLPADIAILKTLVYKIKV